MSGCGRTFSKMNSFEDRAVLTIEEIQNAIGEKVGVDLDCVDWHFSTENFKSFCPLGCRIPTNTTPEQGECDTKVEQ